MTYVDGFVLPLPKDKLDQYKEMAAMAAKTWMEEGALSYKECVIEDAVPTPPDGMPPEFKLTKFADLARTKDGETVIFAFITFKSREHRDEVNAKVHEKMSEMCSGEDFELPFDVARMAYGGFETIVDL